MQKITIILSLVSKKTFCMISVITELTTTPSSLILNFKESRYKPLSETRTLWGFFGPWFAKRIQQKLIILRILCSFDMDCDMPGWPPFSPPSHAKPVKLTDGPSSNLWTKIIQISEMVAVRHLRLTNSGIFLIPYQKEE